MKLLWYLDRGAVLFTGIVAGAVIALSFQYGGKPFAGLFGGAASQAPLPAIPPPPAAGCTEHFPLSSQVIAGLRANRPLRIGIFGDSFGDGLWQAATRSFRESQGFKVYQFSREGTGFTQGQKPDVLEDARQKLAQQPIDIALINFGANDAHGIWVNGQAAPYMSKPWQAQVSSRIKALVHYLQGQGVAVGWVGLPRMRKPDFDHDVQVMNAFYAGLLCKLHVPFVDPVAVTEDSRHQFAIELIDPDTKTPYLARADDGIHMSVRGYRVMADPLFKRIAALAPPETPSSDEEK